MLIRAGVFTVAATDLKLDTVGDRFQLLVRALINLISTGASTCRADAQGRRVFGFRLGPGWVDCLGGLSSL
eukprot:6686293-Prymnesium_polylepis.1